MKEILRFHSLYVPLEPLFGWGMFHSGTLIHSLHSQALLLSNSFLINLVLWICIYVVLASSASVYVCGCCYYIINHWHGLYNFLAWLAGLWSICASVEAHLKYYGFVSHESDLRDCSGSQQVA